MDFYYRTRVFFFLSNLGRAESGRWYLGEVHGLLANRDHMSIGRFPFHHGAPMPQKDFGEMFPQQPPPVAKKEATVPLF